MYVTKEQLLTVLGASDAISDKDAITQITVVHNGNVQVSGKTFQTGKEIDFTMTLKPDRNILSNNKNLIKG